MQGTCVGFPLELVEEDELDDADELDDEDELDEDAELDELEDEDELELDDADAPLEDEPVEDEPVEDEPVDDALLGEPPPVSACPLLDDAAPPVPPLVEVLEP